MWPIWLIQTRSLKQNESRTTRSQCYRWETIHYYSCIFITRDLVSYLLFKFVRVHEARRSYLDVMPSHAKYYISITFTIVGQILARETTPAMFSRWKYLFLFRKQIFRCNIVKILHDFTSKEVSSIFQNSWRATKLPSCIAVMHIVHWVHLFHHMQRLLYMIKINLLKNQRSDLEFCLRGYTDWINA